MDTDQPMMANRDALTACLLRFSKRNALYLGLLLLLLVALAKNTPLLLGDLPDWIQQGQQLAAHWFGGHVDSRYLIKPYPVPNASLTVLIAIIGMATGFELAAKIIVLATTLILGLLTLRLIERLDPENAQYKSIVAMSCLVLSSSLFNGYVSYQIALCLLIGFLYWALVLGRRSILGTSLFAIAIFFSHGAVFAIFVLILAILTFQKPKQPQLIASLVVPFLLGAWYVYGQKHLHSHVGYSPMMHRFGSIKALIEYKAYTFAKLGPFHNFELADGKTLYAKRPLFYYAGIASNLIFAAFLAWQCVLAFKNSLRDQTSHIGKGIAMASFAVIALSLVLPPSMLDLVNPGERILIPAITIIIMLPGVARTYWKPVAALVSVWLCAAALFYFRADTNYASVQAKHKQYIANGGGDKASAVADDSMMSSKGKGARALFEHHAYRFFYVYSAFRENAVAKLAFDTGLFYEHARNEVSLKDLLKQEPTALCYLGLPSPKGATLDDALWAVAEAKRNGWDGVITGIGGYDDPNTIDMSGLKAVLTAAAKNGLHVHLRLLQPANPTINIAGIQEPSEWADKFNNNQPWEQPYRPPQAVAVQVAKLVWQPAIDIAVNAYKGQHLEPKDYVTAEALNEADMGGANGPALGRWSSLRDTFDQSKEEWKAYLKSHSQNDYNKAKSDFLKVFPESLWDGDHPLPEGTIEPEFFAMLHQMLAVIDDHGIKIYPLTLEGEAGSVGQAEIDSYNGPDAKWLAQHYGNRAGFNRFMTVPASSPDACAQKYMEEAQAQIDRMRKNPLLTGELFNTEFGMENKPNLINGGFDIAQGREAVLQAERRQPGIVGGGFFISFGNNKLQAGFNIYDQDRKPVGTFTVAPNHK